MTHLSAEQIPPTRWARTVNDALEVLISSTVKDLVAGTGLVFEDRGEHRLKGVHEPWHLYEAAAASAA
jgi:class 3 adenylate cyclase